MNVEGVLLDNVGAVQVGLGNNAKKLIVSGMVKNIDSGSVCVVWYERFGDDIDWYKCGWGEIECADYGCLCEGV